MILKKEKKRLKQITFQSTMFSLLIVIIGRGTSYLKLLSNLRDNLRKIFLSKISSTSLLVVNQIST